MKIVAYKCLNCGDTVYSRANHDFRWCSCGSMYVDGGTTFVNDLSEGYTRIGGDFDYIKSVEYDLDIDRSIDWVKNILWNDWNKRIDEYGKHRDLNYTDDVREIAKAKRLLSDTIRNS